MKPTDFAKALSDYLGVHLPGQRNVSVNTIQSYRDTFKLLLRYCEQHGQLSIERLCLRHIDQRLILGFLSWLEQNRHNSVSTRNQRLACIHGFYRYLQQQEPVGLLSHQQILSIPIKKTSTPTIAYLTPDAVQLILAQPEVSTAKGRRDLTLLGVLYDTGARVQELADLCVGDVRLEPPAIVTLTGKGRKQRQVPLMTNTQSLLKQYLAESFPVPAGKQQHPLFFNRQHGKMTRAGIAYVLDKYVCQARALSPSLPRKITPHVLRHYLPFLTISCSVTLP